MDTALPPSAPGTVRLCAADTTQQERDGLVERGFTLVRETENLVNFLEPSIPIREDDEWGASEVRFYASVGVRIKIVRQPCFCYEYCKDPSPGRFDYSQVALDGDLASKPVPKQRAMTIDERIEYHETDRRAREAKAQRRQERDRAAQAGERRSFLAALGDIRDDMEDAANEEVAKVIAACSARQTEFLNAMEGRVMFKTSEKERAPVEGFSTTPFYTTVQGVLSVTDAYEQGAAGAFLAGSTSLSPVLLAYYANGLVGSLMRAYNDHHDIVLRPENFWAAILTQFSNYVNANAEELRSKLVSHDNTKELIVTGDRIDDMVIIMTNHITAQLKDASIREWILPSFTTTTATDVVVCGVAMMATMQQYFSYTMQSFCGIPNVTLLGTPADYEDLARRVDRLLEFDNGTGVMKKWHEYLKPIFAELVAASQGGKPHNLEFWSRVYSDHSEGSGSSLMSGWVTAFCCFDSKGKWQGDRHDYTHWNEVEKKVEHNTSVYPVIDTADIPASIVSVPVKLIDAITQAETKTRMFAGSFAIHVIGDCALQPRLDWAMAVVDTENIKKE
jgi:hypothetical protein